ncbi:MAG: chorismate mutase [Clostridiales bacterium]|nr:chorismate mutase [Clostridiales bacterium]
MKTLEELRRQIDAADKDILDAFDRRLAAAKCIGEIKRIQGKPIYDEKREQEKIESLTKLAGFESKQYIERLYTEIMGIAKDLEYKPLFGVLGKSLPHTYSPEIHSMITSDYAYTVIEREEDELEALWKQGADGIYGGFNVTIPYKKNACAMCDELTSCARGTGAVNTVVFRKDGTSLGANTDVYGFKYMLKSSGIDPAGKTVLILGTGGASAAVNAALKELNAGDIRFVSRSGEIDYTNVYDVCADAEVIVNCTPVGMYPEIMQSPVDITRFSKLEAVADLIYNPSCTKLLYDAGNAGLKCAGGLKMLVAQAFKASAFFRGASDDEAAETAVDAADIERVTEVLENKMKNITIIGMPGSGKSALASELSVHLNRAVTDLDDLFTETYGKTPAQTITEEGEDSFRRKESLVAAKALAGSGAVISCGGGIVTREENFFPLKCNSVVIYNERPLNVLCGKDRPLTARNGVEALYAQRREAYESLADIVISVGSKDTREEYLKEAVRIYDENTCT